MLDQDAHVVPDPIAFQRIVFLTCCLLEAGMGNVRESFCKPVHHLPDSAQLFLQSDSPSLPPAAPAGQQHRVCHAIGITFSSRTHT